ncbi:hypothetical protein L1987_45608 [Smallanthus sonchifolius]|uniref:Uncharacterized protein n=1 Tax=Smallanthus sonchifolius TaxID=185202 RepID=A0ACB9FXG3_9ASTR|nr:hypothetical protein L1987_45608 [Smallanthus sonchifolius]
MERIQKACTTELAITSICFHFAVPGERTVKTLSLSRALTIPETTSIYEACCRMAARRVDALLLTDSNALLSGILTDKDIAAKVIAHELDFICSKDGEVMDPSMDGTCDVSSNENT